MAMSPERSPREEAPIGTMRHSPVELNDLIMIEEELLASEPDSFAYQVGLRSLHLRWENVFGMKRIPLSYPEIPPDDVSKRISYAHIRPDDVGKLIGPTGPAMLRRISGMINLAAVGMEWPLEALDVYRQIDPEIDDRYMKSVVVVLKLRTSFDKADEMLKSFYPALQTFTDSLSDDDRSVFNGRINFDVESVAPPESNDNLIK